MKPISRETILDRRQPLMRWSAVLAGTVLTIGIWILLQTLGMGLGLTAVNVDDSGNLRSLAIGTGIWSIIAPLIAMFIGAFVVGRLSGTFERRVGAMHGSVMWALATALGLWAAVSVVGALASNVTQVGIVAADNLDTGSLGVDTNDLMTQGSERADRTDALGAADKTGKALLFGGIAMLLSLITAMIGGALGARSTARREPFDQTPTRSTIVTPPTESTTIVTGTTET